MAKRTPSPRSNLESDSFPDYIEISDMEGPSRGGITRSSAGRQVQGVTETDGCRPVRSTLPPTEHNRDWKTQGGYAGSTVGELWSHAMTQPTPWHTMERPSPQQTTFGSGTFMEPMTFHRRSSPERSTFGSGTSVVPVTVVRQPSPEQRTLGSGTFVDPMSGARQPSPEQRPFGSGTYMDQMASARQPLPEQITFGGGTFMDPMSGARQPSPEQRTLGSGTFVDPMTVVRQSSPGQRTLSMFPTQLGEEEVVADRDQSDEESTQSLITTAMETWTIEDDDDVPLPEETPFVDPALFAQDEDGDTNLHLAIISERSDFALCLIHVAPDPLWLDRTNNLKQTPLHLATIRRQPTVIRRLLSRGAKRVVHDLRGNTPLHIACENGHLNCVHELTSSCPASVMTSDDLGFNAPNYKGQTCLHLAASKNQLDVIRYLVENCRLNVNQKELTRGCTILHRAVISSNLELLDYLLSLPASFELIIDEPTYDGYTALHFAYLTQQTHIVQRLLSAGAHPVVFNDWPPPQA